jgi:hypothetical protein
LKGDVSREDYKEMLAWLDGSLEWARRMRRTRLVELLNAVRVEILFDVELSEGARSIRARSNAPALDSTRVI